MKKLAHPSLFFVLTGLLVSMTLAGCGGGPSLGPTVTVSGQVTHNSKPLSKASIWFTAAKSGSSFHADLNDDGSYTLKLLDAVAGDTFSVSFSGLQAPEHQPKDKVDGAGLPMTAPLPAIPGRFYDGSTSQLQAKIDNAEPHQFNFDLPAK